MACENGKNAGTCSKGLIQIWGSKNCHFTATWNSRFQWDAVAGIAWSCTHWCENPCQFRSSHWVLDLALPKVLHSAPCHFSRSISMRSSCHLRSPRSKWEKSLFQVQNVPVSPDPLDPGSRGKVKWVASNTFRLKVAGIPLRQRCLSKNAAPAFQLPIATGGPSPPSRSPRWWTGHIGRCLVGRNSKKHPERLSVPIYWDRK